jgi:hypothetical protein
MLRVKMRGSAAVAMSSVLLVAALAALAPTLLTPRQTSFIREPQPGQTCFGGFSPSECKPQTKTQFTRDPDAPWYKAQGTCCVNSVEGLATQCHRSISSACDRRAYVFIGPRGNPLHEGICCGFEPRDKANLKRTLAPFCMADVYESYCKEGRGKAVLNRWKMTYDSHGGSVNGACCIEPVPGFATVCQDGVAESLCPLTFTSMYIGPRGGGASSVGTCCKRRPVSSKVAAAAAMIAGSGVRSTNERAMIPTAIPTAVPVAETAHDGTPHAVTTAVPI